MTTTLSEWAKEFLRESHVAVISTLNKDGSSHLASIWYVLADDGEVVLTTTSGSQKAKNLRRDPRIGLCIGAAGYSVSLYGQVAISEDPALVRQDIERIANHYIKEEATRPRVVANLIQRGPIALHFMPNKITEFSVQHSGSIMSR
jgi:PPOX class probable F420-dependent enzyme